jgi:serine/threonine protein kinase
MCRTAPSAVLRTPSSMTEISTSIANDAAAQLERMLHARLDALQSGECAEERFLQEIHALRESAPTLVWTTLALIDQRYRRGQLTSQLFRSINSKLARRALEEHEFGATIDLHPVNRPVQSGVVAAAPAADAGRADLIEHAHGASALAAPPLTPQNAPSARSAEASASAWLHEPGRVLQGRYVLECVLGRGGMGTVFRALDQQRADLPEGNRRVAVKILDESLRRRPETLADLRREFYCAQALAHPNIVKVYEMHHDEDVAFFTMELLQGELLSALLEKTQPLPVDRSYAWAIIRSVGAALAHAHLRNVVHGDLKPQNIIITQSGEVRILDFGASGVATSQWVASDSLQRSRFPPVTLAYACCELLDGQQTDPRDDLYALACFSYELLAGKHPFERRRSTEARELGMQPLRPPGLTERQWRALQLGLSWRREGRSCSVRDWLAMLGLELAAERLPPVQASGALRARAPQGRTAVPVLLLALVVPLGLWALSHTSLAHKVKTSGASETAHSRPESTLPAPTASAVALGVAALPASTPVELGSQVSAPPTQSVAATAIENVGPSIAPSAPRRTASNGIIFSAETYRVRSDEHFAEIDIHRSNESRVTSSFEWWTEGASARPGIDFIAQNRTTQIFPTGRLWTKLFVRIVPNAERAHIQTFYVNITEPSVGSKLGAVARAAILIPPSATARDTPSIQSAQRVP